MLTPVHTKVQHVVRVATPDHRPRRYSNSNNNNNNNIIIIIIIKASQE